MTGNEILAASAMSPNELVQQLTDLDMARAALKKMATDLTFTLDVTVNIGAIKWDELLAIRKRIDELDSAVMNRQHEVRNELVYRFEKPFERPVTEDEAHD